MENKITHLFVIDDTYSPRPRNLPAGQVLQTVSSEPTNGLSGILISALRGEYPDAEFIKVRGFEAMAPATDAKRKEIGNKKFSVAPVQTLVGMWPVYYWHVLMKDRADPLSQG